MKPIQLHRVESVYSGKTGNCYCGCSGKYWYPDAETAAYPDAKTATYSDFVSLPKVKRIVNKLNRNLDQLTAIDDRVFTLTIGHHDWTVYLKPYTNLDLLEDKLDELHNKLREVVKKCGI